MALDAAAILSADHDELASFQEKGELEDGQHVKGPHFVVNVALQLSLPRPFDRLALTFPTLHLFETRPSHLVAVDCRHSFGCLRGRAANARSSVLLQRCQLRNQSFPMLQLVLLVITDHRATGGVLGQHSALGRHSRVREGEETASLASCEHCCAARLVPEQHLFHLEVGEGLCCLLSVLAEEQHFCDGGHWKGSDWTVLEDRLVRDECVQVAHVRQFLSRDELHVAQRLIPKLRLLEAAPSLLIAQDIYSPVDADEPANNDELDVVVDSRPKVEHVLIGQQRVQGPLRHCPPSIPHCDVLAVPAPFVA